MLEVFFYLLFVLGAVLTAWGFKEFSPAILLLAGIVLFSVGLMVMVQGIEREINTQITKVSVSPITWDANKTSVFFTVENDLSVKIPARKTAKKISKNTIKIVIPFSPPSYFHQQQNPFCASKNPSAIQPPQSLVQYYTSLNQN